MCEGPVEPEWAVLTTDEFRELLAKARAPGQSPSIRDRVVALLAPPIASEAAAVSSDLGSADSASLERAGRHAVARALERLEGGCFCRDIRERVRLAMLFAAARAGSSRARASTCLVQLVSSAVLEQAKAVRDIDPPAIDRLTTNGAEGLDHRRLQVLHEIGCSAVLRLIGYVERGALNEETYIGTAPRHARDAMLLALTRRGDDSPARNSILTMYDSDIRASARTIWMRYKSALSQRQAPLDVDDIHSHGLLGVNHAIDAATFEWAKGAFAWYARRSALHAQLGAVRRALRGPTDQDDPDQTASTSEPGEPPPKPLLTENEILELVDQLPPRYRLVIRLQLEGWSGAEIAAHPEMLLGGSKDPPNAARAMLFRARRAFRKVINRTLSGKASTKGQP